MARIRKIVSRVTPQFLKNIYHYLRTKSQVSRKSKIPTEQVFSEIYRKKLWGSDDSNTETPFYSGPGSANSNTKLYIDYIEKFIEQHNLRSITDLGCGDFRLMKQLVSRIPELKYIGVDVVPELIEYNNKKYSNDNVSFKYINAVEGELPNGEIITIRQVLQHLSNNQIKKILAKLSKYRYALITEHLPLSGKIKFNLDKPQDDNIRLFMNSGVFIDKPPFNLQAEKVLEYREDLGTVPAVIRTYLVSFNHG